MFVSTMEKDYKALEVAIKTIIQCYFKQDYAGSCKAHATFIENLKKSC